MIARNQLINLYNFSFFQIVKNLVEDAFENCDLNKNGKLEHEQFKKFCKRHPELLVTLETSLIQHTWEEGQRSEKNIQNIDTSQSKKIILLGSRLYSRTISAFWNA